MAVGAAERLVAVQERLDAVRAGGEIREARAGKPSTSPSKTAGAPAFQPSTSMPKTCWLLSALSVIWRRGSSAGSFEMSRRSRPSSGAALWPRRR